MSAKETPYLPLAVLGFGNMGQAIIKGLLTKQVFPPEQIYIYEPDVDKQKIALDLGLNVVTEPITLAQQCNSILIAVKPQIIQSALASFRGQWSKDRLVISVAAGISIQYLKDILGEPEQKVVRTMPNTPALVQAGITGMSSSKECSSTDVEFATMIFEAVGKVLLVEESQIDIVTAVSGSGPAYYFYLSEAIIEAGKELGLGATDAELLVRSTIYGAGLLMMSQDEPPEVLRARVTSKGGTTESAINQLKACQFKNIVKQAVFSAYRRAKELGK